ncbi:secretion-regulating guanine nucleotide exchange factor isoform X1 [Bactrocera neohumeralis]|uniref:secretion-regulating guanine nucleotide exchange factor isoform X1 n=2 Tax=Bactrocera tryoni TaxID=59916 RepID=UPI001A96101F|nr:secretion-regulating guanine nucleotide exchange factor isoform X1 [Bactrocera tryoni]XP_050321970.1 secretion-regulating guanine nucleotide exchange factor isoform X1 [Bactrocera neohumeralis]
MSVYAWGANSHGQLSLGFESELCMSPQLVREYTFNPNSVRRIRGGGGHVLVLDANGRIHACGWNGRGQLGLNSTEECFNTFQTIPGEYFGDVPVESISCGWDISGCITVTKKLYVWGSNSFQQLGLCQREFNAVRRPLAVILPRNDTPARISFGLRHCAILTADHKVYVFGRLRIGDEPPSDLCITSTTLNCAPVIKIQASEPSELRIIGVVSGQNHILLKVIDLEYGDSAKRVIALGDNKFGQANSFQFDEEIKQIATGWTHNAVTLKDNRILTWGRNCYGQLGIGSVTQNQATPQELDLPSSIIESRLHLGSEHGLLRSTNGEVYTWGWNEHGNCGNDGTENLCSPTRIQLPGPCKIAGTGAGFCYAICEVPTERST